MGKSISLQRFVWGGSVLGKVFITRTNGLINGPVWEYWRRKWSLRRCISNAAEAGKKAVALCTIAGF